MDAYASLSLGELSFVDAEDVLTFSCGDEPWAAVVDQYFHEEAFQHQQDSDAVTYVVRNSSDGTLVALAAFAITAFSWPKPTSKSKEPAVIVLNFGVARNLHGTTTDGVDVSGLHGFSVRRSP